MKPPTLIITIGIFALTLFYLAVPAKADLPVHCLKSEIAGKWEFELTKARKGFNYFKNKCGHRVPDDESSSYKSMKDNFTAHATIEASLKKSNHLDVLNDSSKVLPSKEGNWTMVYDEGFEMHIGTLHFFTFSEYHPDEKDSKKYVSNCGKTLVGWYHDFAKDEYGCVRGKKLDIKEKELEKDNNEEKIKVLDKEIVKSRFLQRKGNKLLQHVPISLSHHLNAKGRISEASRFKAEEQSNVEMLMLSKEFRDHGKILERINNIPKTWTADMHQDFNNTTLHELNRFAARSKSNFGTKNFENPKKSKEDSKDKEKSGHSSDDLSDLPKELSWKEHLPPIFSQGGCGSCYAISTLAMLSSRLSIHHKINVTLSVQHAIDCNYYNQGCDGGYPGLVSKFGTESFFVKNSCKRYVASNQKCDRSCGDEDPDTVYRVDRKSVV